MGSLITDVAPDTFAAIAAACEAFGADPFDVLPVWFSESGFRTDVVNAIGAAGIFQVIPSTLEGLGFKRGDGRWRGAKDFDALARQAEFNGDKDRAAHCKRDAFALRLQFSHEFAELTHHEQIAFATVYYTPHKGRLGSVSRVYLANFLPGELETHGGELDDPSWTIVARGDPRRYGWAYAQNATLDRDGDLRITMGELAMAARRAAAGSGRYHELEARMRAHLGLPEAPPVTLPERPTFDLRTVRGLEESLGAIRRKDGRPYYVAADGVSPGAVDGVRGPRLEAAVRAFQADHEPMFGADGVPGPATRAAIAVELRALGL